MSDVDATDEPNLFSYLSSVPAVAAFIEDRIYQGRIPQQVKGRTARVMDCAVYQRVGDTRAVTHCGSEGLVAAQYQIDSYSPDDVRVLKVARAIRRALLDYSGPMGDVEVKNVFITTSFDSQDEEPGLCRRTQTYTIWYAEAEG